MKFAGKTVFGSSGGGVPARYLTTFTVKRPDKPPLLLPCMAATAVTADEHCILYARPDGSIALQLGSLLWVALDEELGWLTTTDDVAHAASLTLGGTPAGRTWTVATTSGPKAVSYSTGPGTPLLTDFGESPGVFAPTVVTPSLDEIARTRSAPKADLTHVDLRGVALDRVDLTAAQLDHALLDGTRLTSCTLTRARFAGATLGSAVLDGSVLDAADFTGADLTGAAWGTPASAKGVVLTNCSARGAVLGGRPTPPDCTGAVLAGADLRGADLRGLPLNNASAGGARLSGCRLDKAVLDGADLTGAITDGATLTFAFLRGVSAQGASFAHADLSHADLTRARMGVRVWLFALPGTFGADLDTHAYVQPALVTAFATNGVRISLEDPVKVVDKGRRWRIVDPHAPYDLIVNASGTIDVFDARPDLRPAVLRGAVCSQTTATRASLAGADLRGVLWCDAPASLAQADLEDAALGGAFLAGTDFTQARLNGTDLSGTVLVQAVLRGCVFGPVTSGRSCSLEGALLHGADFSDATLLGALLVDAAVSTDRGVPLFRLPLSAAPQLTTDGIHALAPLFEKVRRPLGSAPTVAHARQWLLDNRADSDPGVPAAYLVRFLGRQFDVFDASGGGVLFVLPNSAEPLLNHATAPPALVRMFAAGGLYSLAPDAPITARSYWEIAVGEDAPVASVATYGRLRVFAEADGLPVFGAVLVTPHGWPSMPDPLAFGPTVGLAGALNRDSLGPNGEPRAWCDERLITYEQLITAVAGNP